MRPGALNRRLGPVGGVISRFLTLGKCFKNSSLCPGGRATE